MSDSYVAQKIRDALLMAEGSRARAQRILLARVQDDDRLLRGLAAPFLKAIVTSAVERATRGQRDAAPAAPVPSGRVAGRAPQPRTLPPEALDTVLAQLGRQLAAEARGAPASGSSSRPATADPAVRRGSDHATTIRALAAVYKRKHER